MDIRIHNHNNDILLMKQNLSNYNTQYNNTQIIHNINTNNTKIINNNTNNTQMHVIFATQIIHNIKLLMKQTRSIFK